MHVRSAVVASLLVSSVSAQTTFRPAYVKSPIPSEPAMIPGLMADLDGDGHVDLISPNGDRVAWGKGDLSFDPVTKVPGAARLRVEIQIRGRRAVAVGDLDGDGRPDLLRIGLSGCEWIRGLPGRAFSAPTPVPASPYDWLDLGDFDGDGDLDLYFDDFAVGAILLNDGAGQFTRSPHTFRTGKSFEVVDIDGDGDDDLVGRKTTGFAPPPGNRDPMDPDRIGVVLSNGTGLTELTPLPGPGYDVSPADMNGDGAMDLVRLRFDRVVEVWLGDGSGFRFSLHASAGTPEPFVLPGGSHEIAVDDFNDDGYIDVIADNGLVLLFYAGVSEGGLQPPIPLEGDEGTFFVAFGEMDSADLDGDGAPELLLPRMGRLFRGRAGQIPMAITRGFLGLADIPEGMLVGDFDGDGDVDLFGAAIGPFSPPAGGPWMLQTSRGVFGDSLSPIGQFFVRTFSRHAIRGAFDLDADGVDEVVFGGASFPPVRIRDFSNGVIAPAEFADTETAEAADLDLDGDIDFLVTKTGALQFALWNDGSGARFGSSPLWASPPSLPLRIRAVHDVDADGDPDLVFTAFSGQGSAPGTIGYVALNDGAGSFDSRLPIVSTRTVGRVDVDFVRVGDLDGDGNAELFISYFQFPAVGPYPDGIWYERDATGRFLESSRFVDPLLLRSRELADVDSDGDIDVLTWESDPADSLLLNDGSGGFTAGVSELPEPYADQSRLGRVVYDADGDGDLDLAGVGRFYVNQLRDIEALRDPILGRSYVVRVVSQGGHATIPSVVFLGFSPDQRVQGVDLGFGTLFLEDPMLGVFLQTSVPDGSVEFETVTPNVPALVGSGFTVQALIASPNDTGGVDFGLTAYLRETIIF